MTENSFYNYRKITENLIFNSFVFDNVGNIVQTDGKVLCLVTKNGMSLEMEISKDALVQSGILSLDINETFENAVENETPSIEEENFQTEDEELSIQKSSSEFTWDDKSTAFLIDKYTEYLPLVGPMKRFKNKKTLFDKIADEMKNQLNFNCNGKQCETRLKTVKRRKMNDKKNNATSGSMRQNIQFENEFSKLAAIDDNLVPEVMISTDRIEINTKAVKEKKPVNNKRKIEDVLWEINERKEENKKARHNEKMEMLKLILNSLNNGSK